MQLVDTAVAVVGTLQRESGVEACLSNCEGVVVGVGERLVASTRILVESK